MNDFNSTMKYCGEDPTNSEAKNTFFRNFSEFLTLFNKISQENKEREAMNRVHEQRQQLLQKASTETQVEKSADDEAADTIDILIKKLRSVDPQQTIPGSSVPGTSSHPEKRSTPRTNRDQNLLSRAMTLKSGIQNL